MAKYSEQFKLMVVREYQEGKMGYQRLAKKHGIKSSYQVQKWIKMYNEFGVEGLMKKRHKEVYSVKFKLDVLKYMRNTGASLIDTALQFGITNPSMIDAWKKALLDGGPEAMNRPKGRPPMSDKPKKNVTKQANDKDMTREQQLESENELLRLEVEYLKKLRAFQMDPEGYLEKHKQRYHSNSKKNFN